MLFIVYLHDSSQSRPNTSGESAQNPLGSWTTRTVHGEWNKECMIWLSNGFCIRCPDSSHVRPASMASTSDSEIISFVRGTFTTTIYIPSPDLQPHNNVRAPVYRLSTATAFCTSVLPSPFLHISLVNWFLGRSSSHNFALVRRTTLDSLIAIDLSI